MDKSKSQDKWSDEDDGLWAVFGSIHRALKADGDPVGIDEGVNQLRQALLQSQSFPVALPASSWGRLKAKIIRLTGRSAGITACLEWLRKTGEFSEEDLKVIRRANLLYEKESGAVFLRTRGLRLTTATGMIAATTFFGGIWIGWLASVDRVGFQLMAESLAIGGILGLIAGRVRDCSFKFENIRERVSSLAPWLLE